MDNNEPVTIYTMEQVYKFAVNFHIFKSVTKDEILKGCHLALESLWDKDLQSKTIEEQAQVCRPCIDNFIKALSPLMEKGVIPIEHDDCFTTDVPYNKVESDDVMKNMPPCYWIDPNEPVEVTGTAKYNVSLNEIMKAAKMVQNQLV